MIRPRALGLAGCVVAATLAALPFVSSPRGAADTLPARLTDQQFWTIVSDFSELGGYFRSDNLLSNEAWLQHAIPDLIKTAKPNGIYLGVGPEQNFTYITSLRPKMAFIVDVRRGNLHLHLMYKALFEMAGDRAGFVSRLFSRQRPDALGSASTAQTIFQAYADAKPDEALYRENLKTIKDRLVTKHRFALSSDDLQGIEYIYHAFYQFGPAIQYSSTGYRGGRYQPSYADLMTATDAEGEPRGYLASEERFAFLKDLEAKNLLVPVVGNFGGPKALAAVGRYLKQRHAIVSAFYLSNVEQYLRQDGLWRNFCGNVAALPLDESSTFIRSVRRRRSGFYSGLGPVLGAMAAEVKNCG